MMNLKRRLKVLIIQGYANQKGGPRTVLTHLLNHLDTTRFEPLLLFLSPGELVDKYRNKGIEVRVIYSGRLRNILKVFITILKITVLIRLKQIDVVFSNCERTHIYGGIAAYLTMRPSIFYWHSFVTLDLMNRLIFCIPTSVILANSKYTKIALETCLSKKLSKKVKLLYYGIEIPSLINSTNELRKAINLPLKVPIVTMVGLFMEWKGQKYFIKAIPKILNAFPTTKFLLVGDARAESDSDKVYANKVRKLVTDFKLTDSVIFMSYREDVLDIMAASDIIVHASIGPEPFGLVIIEAISVGKPVIASRIGAPKEIIEDGVDGILVPPKDSEAIANACIKLLKDPMLCKNMGKYGREKVEKYFGVNGMIKEVEEVWLSLSRHSRNL
ncbi:MAG: glycosyltransferase family 4 protein [bacterium]|nr:glycosyltransferase family 4 protein [bacterium]